MVFLLITSIYNYLYTCLQNFACYKIAYMYIFVFLNFNILQFCKLFSLKRVYRINANRNTHVKRIITCKYIRKLEKEKGFTVAQRELYRDRNRQRVKEKRTTPRFSAIRPKAKITRHLKARVTGELKAFSTSTKRVVAIQSILFDTIPHLTLSQPQLSRSTHLNPTVANQRGLNLFFFYLRQRSPGGSRRTPWI